MERILKWMTPESNFSFLMGTENMLMNGLKKYRLTLYPSFVIAGFSLYIFFGSMLFVIKLLILSKNVSRQLLYSRPKCHLFPDLYCYRPDDYP